MTDNYSANYSQFFNENQHKLLRNLTEDWQSFKELSIRTGFSIEEIQFLIMDFVELQNFLIRKQGLLARSINFIILSSSNDKIKLGKEGKLILKVLAGEEFLRKFQKRENENFELRILKQRFEENVERRPGRK